MFYNTKYLNKRNKIIRNNSYSAKFSNFNQIQAISKRKLIDKIIN